MNPTTPNPGAIRPNSDLRERVARASILVDTAGQLLSLADRHPEKVITPTFLATIWRSLRRGADLIDPPGDVASAHHIVDELLRAADREPFMAIGHFVEHGSGAALIASAAGADRAGEAFAEQLLNEECPLAPSGDDTIVSMPRWKLAGLLARAAEGAVCWSAVTDARGCRGQGGAQ